MSEKDYRVIICYNLKAKKADLTKPIRVKCSNRYINKYGSLTNSGRKKLKEMGLEQIDIII